MAGRASMILTEPEPDLIESHAISSGNVRYTELCSRFRTLNSTDPALRQEGVRSDLGGHRPQGHARLIAVRRPVRVLPRVRRARVELDRDRTLPRPNLL